jgi:cytochrome c oxidase assembly protein subunit 11
VAVGIYVVFLLSGVFKHERAAEDTMGIGKMVGVALAAFAFTFALVPLYRIACEKVFGVRLEKQAVEAPVACKARSTAR